MVFRRSWFPLSLALTGCLWGCSTVPPPLPPVQDSLSFPLFVPTVEDARRIVTLANDLDNRALSCREALTCEQVQFGRGLVSLFESQEAARASFRRVIEDNPSSPLAGSSMLWLQLIEDTATESATQGPQKPSLYLMGQFVRDWMARELAEDTKQRQSLLTTHKARVETVETVQALQKQVKERDRHIATLESKLEALKIIDQDHEKRKRIIKLPATLP